MKIPAVVLVELNQQKTEREAVVTFIFRRLYCSFPKASEKSDIGAMMTSPSSQLNQPKTF